MIAISVIIPTYNRAKRLKVCLEALARQTQPSDSFEVIVVVDGSTDGTREMLAGLTTPFALTVVHQPNSGQQTARNQGAAHARGRYCLFLDDDIVAEPELVAEHLRLHRQEERVVGIGQLTTEFARPDWFTERFAEGWGEHYRQLEEGVRQPSWPDGYGGNLSVSRAIFRETGGFAPDIRRGHDIEFAYRLHNRGLAFVYLPQAAGMQNEHKRSRELFADAAESGAAWVTLCRRHAGMLPELLGPLGDTSVRESLLREFFSRCGFSPWLLARSGRVLDRTAWGSKWYRFLFSYGYWCGVRRAIADSDTWGRMVKGVPILMYHAFGKPGEPASRFAIPVGRFARQMAWLDRMNYQVLSLKEFLQHRRQHRLPPPRSVIITIDDGYEETATLAHPILRRYGFPATVFLVSSKIGDLNDWTDDETLRGRPLLSWSTIREMASQGVEFGAHTRTHINLADVTVEEARAEIVGAKEEIEHVLEQPIAAVAYPYGEFSETVEALADEAGFLGGCSVQRGLNVWSTPLTALRRIEVEGTWSLPRFLAILRLGGPLQL